MTVQISDLVRCPDFSAVVADRVWKAFWQPKGYPLDIIAMWVRANLAGAPMPFCLVAHQDDEFVGTASLVASDMPDYPDLSPWIAAVWVDPHRRGQGTGTALIGEAADRAFQRGFERVHLCAAPDSRSFLARIGWKRIDKGAGTRKLDIFRRTIDGLSRS